MLMGIAMDCLCCRQAVVSVHLPGPGEAVLPALQRPRLLQARLPANHHAAVRAPSGPTASRAPAGGRGHGFLKVSVARLCAFPPLQLSVLRAGAARGDPGGRRRRSLRAPSPGVRQEEADPSQAPHAQAGRGVSRNGGGGRPGRGAPPPRGEVTGFLLLQAGLREEARQHQAGEREGASEAQVQAGAQGRPEGDQEGLALPGRREAQGGHGQVSRDVVYLFIYFLKNCLGFSLFG